MTPSPPADPKVPVDPVDALRLLVVDLQALVDRFGLAEGPEPGRPEQTTANRHFVQALQAAQERVAGPRAVVMLLSEHAILKRRFLERLLGPVPDLTLALAPLIAAPVRLEYGPATECVAASAERGLVAVRVPSPTLERGLAVIDTPVIETPAIEDGPTTEGGSATNGLLQCAEQANTLIFVLAADHAIGKSAQTILRQLPEHAAGLEFVVEGAEALNAAARTQAREQLIQTLRENCGIAEPRLTLIASAATEGDEGSYWHGRFATFHSVMMLRGRERWLQATRALIAIALSEVGGEIEQELKSTAPGLRHARLRLGLKDLEGLRTRFHELGRLDGGPDEAVPTSSTPAEFHSPNSGGDAPAPKRQWQSTATESREPSRIHSEPPFVPPMAPPDAAERGWLSEQEARELLAWQARQPRGLRAKLARLLPFSRLTLPVLAFFRIKTAAAAHVRTGAEGSSHPWRLLGGVWALAFGIIALWVMWPRLAAVHEPAAEWDLRSTAAPVPKPAPAASTAAAPPLVMPALHAETEHAGVRDSIPVSTRTGAHTAIRTPLAKPVPQGLRAGAAAPRRHHSFLGIGRLWGWVRHPRGGTPHSATNPSSE